MSGEDEVFETWAVISRTGRVDTCFSMQDAERTVVIFDTEYKGLAPHRIALLREVPHV